VRGGRRRPSRPQAASVCAQDAASAPAAAPGQTRTVNRPVDQTPGQTRAVNRPVKRPVKRRTLEVGDDGHAGAGEARGLAHRGVGGLEERGVLALLGHLGERLVLGALVLRIAGEGCVLVVGVDAVLLVVVVEEVRWWWLRLLLVGVLLS
jgi:hypothetical protein